MIFSHKTTALTHTVLVQDLAKWVSVRRNGTELCVVVM